MKGELNKKKTCRRKRELAKNYGYEGEQEKKGNRFDGREGPHI